MRHRPAIVLGIAGLASAGIPAGCGVLDDDQKSCRLAACIDALMIDFEPPIAVLDRDAGEEGLDFDVEYDGKSVVCIRDGGGVSAHAATGTVEYPCNSIPSTVPGEEPLRTGSITFADGGIGSLWWVPISKWITVRVARKGTVIREASFAPEYREVLTPDGCYMCKSASYRMGEHGVVKLEPDGGVASQSSDRSEISEAAPDR